MEWCSVRLFSVTFAAMILSIAGENQHSATAPSNPPKLSLQSRSMLLMDTVTHLRRELLHFDTMTSFKEYLRMAPPNGKDPSIVLSDDNAVCIDNLDDIIDGLMRKRLWAMKFLDSSGKIPTGLLNGNIINLGDYDQCVSTSSEMNESTPFHGQYCLVSLVIEVPPEIIFGFTGSTAEDMFGSNIVLKTAMCVPSSCKPPAMEHAFNNLLDRVNPWLNETSIPITLRVTIPDTDCHIRSALQFSIGDYIVLAVFCMIILFVILSTIFDLWLRSYRGPCYSTLNKGPRAILAFSAYSNAQRLFNTDSQPDTISCINGLRFLSITWVCLGHRVKYTAQLPATNLTSLLQFIKNWPTMAILNATLAVDTFFVISGLLNAYVFLGFVNKRSSLTTIWFSSLVKRYLRLTPAYAAMIAFTATIFYKMGDGPLWEQLAGQEKEACQEYWWTNLLYFNNYYHTEKLCMMQSWYLSADTQLYILSIFLLYFLKNYRWVGFMLLSILMGVSVAIPFAVSYEEKIRAPIPLTRDMERVDREMAVGYFPTHMRTSSYLVGITAGYILHRIKTGKWSENLVTSFTLRRAFIWIITTSMMMSALFLCYWMFQPEVPYLWFYSSFYIAVHRLAWAIGVAWIILDSTFHKNGVVNRFLSNKFFMPLGRLTYCIYLTHIVVIIHKLGTARQPAYISAYDTFHETIGDIIISIVLATILSLLFESPIMVLEKTLFHDSGKSHGNQPPGKHAGSTSSRIASNMDSNSDCRKKNNKSTSMFKSGQNFDDKLKKAPSVPEYEDDTWPIGENRHQHRAEVSYIPSQEEKAEFFQGNLRSSYNSNMDYRRRFPMSSFLGPHQESEISYAVNPYTKIDYERISMSRTPDIVLHPWESWTAESMSTNRAVSMSARPSAPSPYSRFGNRQRRGPRSPFH
ncbi:nose resistant to fluoxetine protein 6 isoform X2 [Bemisia tabaci]|uniref:nose resistant to fluoxetine protein 6 isoform X2 n=1 Tax=Bemisia tabaci TaxID=7038 RepID=UPI003B285602